MTDTTETGGGQPIDRIEAPLYLARFRRRQDEAEEAGGTGGAGGAGPEAPEAPNGADDLAAPL